MKWSFAIFVLAFVLVLDVSGLSVPQTSKPVLVIGATGKVGRLVVRKLVESGTPVRAMCRDIDLARSVFPVDMRADPEKLALCKGDVTDPTSLSAAIDGVSAVISVHGTFHATPLYKLLIPIFWR